MLLVIVPCVIAGPALSGSLPFAALPDWVLPWCVASSVLGVWHLVMARWALDEDLEFIAGYVQAQEAAILLLPLVLFQGSRGVYRRVFRPDFVAQQRWAQRRAHAQQVKRLQGRLDVPQDFADTIPAMARSIKP